MWLYCFNTYVAIWIPDELTQQMLSYSRLVLREALCHGGSEWLEYDRVFHCQMSINSMLRWSTLNSGLQAATIIVQQSSPGTFCVLCRECAHQASQCALAPLQQQLSTRAPTMSQGISRAPGITRPPKRPETLLNICVSWNRGFQATLHHVFPINSQYLTVSDYTALPCIPVNRLDNSYSNL